MPQKFQLAIGDRFEVPVHFTVRDGAQVKPFRFHLECNRLDAEEARRALTGEGDAAGLTVQEFLHQNIVGWRGQKLVLQADGTPADFSTEALDAMLGISGVGAVLYQAYVGALAAASGTEGQRKN